jgi:hypothetical protein
MDQAPRSVHPAWHYAVLYVAVSLITEITLLTIGRLRIPQDNAVLGPVVLSVPPALAAWLFGYRRPRSFLALAGLTAITTLVLTAIAGRLTGVRTGLAEPIVVRTLSGFVAIYSARALVGLQ